MLYSGKYKPIKGDQIDEIMALNFNNCDLNVPLQRVSEGTYVFGSKNITAKIKNGKLVIRVGGGYMLVNEFL